MHNIGFFINMNYINKREYCVVWKITRDAHNNHINVNSIRKKQDLGFSPLKRCIISKFVGRELARYEQLPAGRHEQTLIRKAGTAPLENLQIQIIVLTGSASDKDGSFLKKM